MAEETKGKQRKRRREKQRCEEIIVERARERINGRKEEVKRKHKVEKS